MKRSDKLLERFIFGADLPMETTPGAPIIELFNDKRVLIENHNGVTAYDCHEVCVRVSYGVVRICGNNLLLARMSKHQLVITGIIDSVSICRGR